MLYYFPATLLHFYYFSQLRIILNLCVKKKKGQSQNALFFKCIIIIFGEKAISRCTRCTRAHCVKVEKKEKRAECCRTVITGEQAATDGGRVKRRGLGGNKHAHAQTHSYNNITKEM